MKTVITERPGYIPAAAFSVAASTMRHLIDAIDQRVTLPHPESQYLEWVATGYTSTKGVHFVFGRMAYLHDIRYLEKDRRVVENRMNSILLPEGGIEMATDANQNLYTIIDVDLESILQKCSLEAMVNRMVKQISGFVRLHV